MAKKILLVEDNQDILNILKELLELEGYEVTGLNYTDSITKSIAQFAPDLVMLDFLLERINGGELCHEIKTTKETSAIPVIMLSAYPRVLDSLGNYGSDAFIAKPFDIAEVLKTVKECIEASMAHA
ncbi:response regulator [Mucilaginibacter xinganensis]|uniref:Response regulatory domain-containing protein n=1 Tax=Mucilaginibacter xinganensis TaxID=1234841 RepID=A0A223NV09_9SPHI|nr:response regulator [Mucilaginibacter xinganensis]ASU33719.1 hypothetical protein MuYL_1823 [Mucilaginibacter xinganensis]